MSREGDLRVQEGLKLAPRHPGWVANLQLVQGSRAVAPQHGPSGVYSTGGFLSCQGFVIRPSLPAVDRPEATATPRLGMALQAFLEALEGKNC